VFETNLFGAMRMNRAVLPSMRNQREGLIAQMSTGLGRFVLPFMGSYSGGKFALEGMTEILRYEVSAFGVDVVIVEPDRYNTDFIEPNGVSYYHRYLRQLSPEDARRRREYGSLAERLRPAGFLTEPPTSRDPQEVADAVAHLVRLPSGQRPVRLLPIETRNSPSSMAWPTASRGPSWRPLDSATFSEPNRGLSRPAPPGRPRRAGGPTSGTHRPPTTAGRRRP
jgi:hypothetical protein